LHICATAVNFHPNGDLLLVAGEDKHMRFFRIDGDKNEKQLAVRVNDMIIQNATFRSSGNNSASGSGAAVGVRGSAEEVVLCGRKPFFYSYDTASGNISKIPGMVP
jgi:U3 small nucleolar RNA-associated protein 18